MLNISLPTHFTLVLWAMASEKRMAPPEETEEARFLQIQQPQQVTQKLSLYMHSKKILPK